MNTDIFWLMLLKPFALMVMLAIAAVLAWPIKRALAPFWHRSALIRVLMDRNPRKNHPVIVTILALLPLLLIFVLGAIYGD